MIDKELVRQRFKKSLNTYDDNAIVQKKLAEKLVELLPDREFSKILEIGCGSGLLTKIIQEKIKPKEYFANDIVDDCEKYIKNIVPNVKFIKGDIEKISIDANFDLIISNASLQWCDNLEQVYYKLRSKLSHGGILAFSVFAEDNFFEINSILNISLCYQKIDKLEGAKLFFLHPEILWFDSPKDVIKHLKFTGVNALKQEFWTKRKLKDFDAKYRKLFDKSGKVSLTYKPVCVFFKNID